jgi:hypothetical protein
MNYIKHLTGFFEKVAKDKTLNPTHVSLYIALFQFWNCNRFRNPISISRDEIMRISKISSKATYHKCLKNLHALGYIKYEPSYNPFKGSHVYLFNFSEELKPQLKKDRIQSSFFEPPNEQVVNKNITSHHTSIEQAQVPFINNTNNTKNSNESKQTLANNFENKNDFQKKTEEKFKFKNNNEMEKEKSSAKKEKAQTNPGHSSSNSFQKPQFTEIFDYFINQEFDIAEAQKFHNYYESNGWLIGGKTQMVDWQAAASNWMNKTEIFNHKPNTTTSKPNHLSTTTDKDYSEPL